MFSLPSSLLSSPLGRAGRSCILATGLTLTLGAASVHAQTAGAGRVKMTHSFLAVAPAGKATVAVPAENVRDTLTAAEANAPMRIRLTLRMRNADELHRRVAAGEIISRQEMAARFLPDIKDHQAVANWLASQGLTVTPAGAAHAIVMASGSPAQLEKAFATHFARVQFKGEQHTSATVAPSVPADIQARISSVHGLQPHLHVRKFSTPVRHLPPAPEAIDGGDFVYGTPPYYVNEISKAYGVTATGLTGAGQTIAIIIDVPPIKSDLRTFYKNNALSQTTDNLTVVNVDNLDAFDQPEGEETLDTEWSSGLAVGAKVVVYATGDLATINDAYGRVLDDLQSGAQPGLHQLSMSFGADEAFETDDDVFGTHDIFAAIAAYGVTLFASSGDNGAYGNDATAVDPSVNYPASDPIVTSVGGTTLNLTTAKTVAKQALKSEFGWSLLSDDSGASGGGYSIFFPRPDYQVGKGVDTTVDQRQVPDVAFAGDPETGAYLILLNERIDIGGTSWSSPCWAALCALANQARANQGNPPLTALNSRLYPLLGTAAFRDILYGFNDHFGLDPAYSCGPGYDRVTGLGVPNFAALSAQLANDAVTQTFFTGQTSLGNGVYYLQFPNGNYFGYYSYLGLPNYLYHFDLGYEYIFNANDGKSGVYFYDFASSDFFYTSPTFPFPYLYDFGLNTVLYYYPDPDNAGHYNTNGVRYFYRFDTGEIIQH